ncbi:phosphonate ABC transporter ATP-binding protein [uncultured Roseovarius sp.]|uniref:phosphonate ABC transporter ATP-binding protein n=1 Tax=uncultured Roseovarius sp. TaxID=293344 RepID=UPI00262B9FB9|nr:ATP-binding cassette domain-containing protein [uncultured Roseovarius sp.]
MTAAIDIADLTLHHPGAEGGRPALSAITLSIKPGESVALLGASGAGKTTLLALCDGRLRGWRGRADVLGNALSPDRAPPKATRIDTGFIFQEFALVERSSVERNVLNGRLGRIPVLAAFFGRHSALDRTATYKAMTEAGIADLAHRRVDSLSGGQRQRVAIARCLAQEPQIILADEPVSNLDPARADDILGLITGAARARGVTSVFSSHQPELAMRFAERVIGLRDGKLQFDRPAADVSPQDIAQIYHDAGPGTPSPPQKPGLRVVT